MRKYVGIFKNYLSISMEYRSNFIGLILGEIVSISTVVILWISVYRSAKTLAGYTFSDTVLYYLLTPLVGIIAQTQISRVVGDDIKDGTLSNKLVKPIRVWLYYFSQASAGKVNSIITILPLYLLVILVGSQLLESSHYTIGSLMLGLFVALCGFLFHFVLDLTFGGLAFYMDSVWWVKHFKYFVFGIFAGISFPLDFFPHTIREIVLLLPFRFLYFTPIRYILGKQAIADIPGDLVILGFWTFIVLLLSRQIWKRGLRTYEAFGN